MNYAAGNYFTGVPGWLGCEVIWLAVDNYRAANHIRHPETACQHCHPGVSAASKQRREIACVAGVAAIALGVVAARLGKSCSSAGTALVDVEAKDFRAALGQSAYICRHQCAGGTAVERDGSDGPGGRVRAVYVCDGLWTAKGKIHAGTSQSERGARCISGRVDSAVHPLYRMPAEGKRAEGGEPGLSLPYWLFRMKSIPPRRPCIQCRRVRGICWKVLRFLLSSGGIAEKFTNCTKNCRWNWLLFPRT